MWTLLWTVPALLLTATGITAQCEGDTDLNGRPTPGECNFLAGDGTFTVPAGVTTFTLSCSSGTGGSSNIRSIGDRFSGGAGSSVTLLVATVEPGTIFRLAVGGQGATGARDLGRTGAGGSSSYGSGGSGGGAENRQTGSGGGGATAVSVGGSTFLVLGGGGAASNGGALLGGKGGDAGVLGPVGSLSSQANGQSGAGQYAGFGGSQVMGGSGGMGESHFLTIFGLADGRTGDQFTVTGLTAGDSRGADGVSVNGDGSGGGGGGFFVCLETRLLMLVPGVYS